MNSPTTPGAEGDHRDDDTSIGRVSLVFLLLLWTIAGLPRTLGAKCRSLMRWWRGHTPTVRRTALLLWTIGFVIIGAGLLADMGGFWNNRPFITNLVTSAAAACFGIPLAVLVIQGLSDQQLHQMERRAARAAATRAFADFALASWGLLNGDKKARQNRESFVETLKEITRYLESMQGAQTWPHSNGGGPGENLLPMMENWDLRATAVQRAFSVCDALWTDLSRNVRSRLIECGEGWLNMFAEGMLVSFIDELREVDLDKVDMDRWRAAWRSGSTPEIVEVITALVNYVCAAENLIYTAAGTYQSVSGDDRPLEPVPRRKAGGAIPVTLPPYRYKDLW